MTFHIYETKFGTALNINGEVQYFATQAAAIDMAVRFAQDADALYTINYYRP